MFGFWTELFLGGCVHICVWLQVEALDEYHDGVIKANEDPRGINNRRAYLMGVLKRLHNEVRPTE